MHLQKVLVTTACITGFIFTGQAFANIVSITVDHPTKMAFQVAHKNERGETVLGEVQQVNISQQLSVPLQLEGYDMVGVIPISVNGHNLPSNVLNFDRPNQCTMTTNAAMPNGEMDFLIGDHQITCRTKGGKFG